MAREAAAIDLRSRPDLAQLVEEIKRTRRPRLIQEDGETVALLVPAGRPRRARQRHLVDTSALPPVPYRTVDEMLADRPPWTGRTFTDDEINTALEDDRIDVARDILDRVTRRPELKFVLPSDVVVSIGDPQEWNVRSVPVSEVPTGWRILDVGHETIEDFREALQPVKTAMWNGPLGLFEQARFAEGSLALAHIFADLNATTVIGGGETAAVVTRAGVAERISHISTGGGASLEYLEGRDLPGITVLDASTNGAP